MAGPLTRAEREEIRAGLVQGWSFRRIGVWVGRDPSTVCREVGRNGGRDRYRAAAADAAARVRARRVGVRKLVADPVLCRRVREGLATMSPAPLVQVLAGEGFSVSHETIYAEAFRVDSVLGDAWEHFARARRYRRRRSHGHHRYDPRPLGVVCFVTDRHRNVTEEPGHWEGDLIVGAQNRSAAVVLTERSTRLVLIGALRSQTTTEVVPTVIDLLTGVDPSMRVSLCWDQGRELTRWHTIATTLGLDMYFCHPRSPWQKPLVENTCGLLRRWLPKQSNLYRPQPELDTITHRLNTMPRRSLNWDTATQRYDQTVASMT